MAAFPNYFPFTTCRTRSDCKKTFNSLGSVSLRHEIYIKKCTVNIEDRNNVCLGKRGSVLVKHDLSELGLCFNIIPCHLFEKKQASRVNAQPKNIVQKYGKSLESAYAIFKLCDREMKPKLCSSISRQYKKARKRINNS